MNCVEKLKWQYPDATDQELVELMSKYCPSHWGIMADPAGCTKAHTPCEDCWNRVIPQTREEHFRDITSKMADVYAAKNHDYGDSFARLRERYPTSILIRLGDKLNRLHTLLTGETAQVKDESIDDTLLDLANYAVMELVERKMDKNENK